MKGEIMPSPSATGRTYFQAFPSEVAGMEDEWLELHPNGDVCGSRFVLSERNWARRIWNAVVAILLLYTGTAFLFRLCFIDCRMPLEIRGKDDWYTVDVVVNALFAADVGFNFFSSYKDIYGREVFNLRRVARRYIFGYFMLDLVACIPWYLLQNDSDNQHLTLNSGIRIARLQRVSRIIQLARVGGLAKVISTGALNNSRCRWVSRLRVVQIGNFVIGLLFIVHVLACGWYVCAAFDQNPEETWVARRVVDTDQGTRLTTRSPFEQWCNCMYFVLAIFTTVGFGDVSAYTLSEVLYVSFTMLVGAVVHGIIISKVINLVTSADQSVEFVKQQVSMVEAFARHTELDATFQQRLREWVRFNASEWTTREFDRDHMKNIITDRNMPAALLNQLPHNLFGGRLLKNSYMLVCPVVDIPPRLPILLALAIMPSSFRAGDVVYQIYDFPIALFLVAQGTFAHVAVPTRSGGVDRKMTPQADSFHTMFDVGPLKDVPRRRKQPKLKQQQRELLQGQPAAHQMYPYQLFSAKAYFGEVEILLNTMRRSTVRCESVDGSLLVLNRQDFKELSEEFVQFGTVWRQCAYRREQKRQRMLTNLKRGVTHRHLAALRIQQFFRKCWNSRAAPLLLPRGLVTQVASDASFLGAHRTRIQQSTGYANQSLPAVHLLQAGIDALREDVRAIQLAMLSGDLDPLRCRCSMACDTPFASI